MAAVHNFSRVWRLARQAMCVSLLAATTGHASTQVVDTPSSAIQCGPTATRELRLRVVNEAGVGQDVLDAALAEVAAIWAGVDVRLTWSFPRGAVDPADSRTIFVMIRPRLAKPQAAAAARANGKSRPPLGWVVFGVDGRPGNLIEVSLEATTSLVLQGELLDKPMSMLPSTAVNPVLGRGLGRVIAHEVGHWFMGRGHERTGLMKPSFGKGDLTEWTSPHLPRTWRNADIVSRMSSTIPCTPVAPADSSTEALTTPTTTSSAS